jgi:hypothetical protein
MRYKRYSFKKHGQLGENNMILKIFAGDFKSGSLDLLGFQLNLCDPENLAEIISLSDISALERLASIDEVMRCEEWSAGIEVTSDLNVLKELTTDKRDKRVLFIVRFQDGRKMIASADEWEWNQLALKVSSLLNGTQSEIPHPSVRSEGYDSCERFDQINWIAATPSWSSIVIGGLLPALAIVAFVFLVDAILCLAFEQWINHFWTMPLWQIAAMALPLALFGAVIIAKLLTKTPPLEPQPIPKTEPAPEICTGR